MNEIRWKMVHILETTPSWMEEEFSAMERNVLQARALKVLGTFMEETGCATSCFEVRPEFWVDKEGRQRKTEFRLRMDIHTERREAGIDFERLGAKICVAVDALKKELNK